MKEYEVRISQQYFGRIYVNAENEEEARKIALETQWTGDEFDEFSVEQKVEEVIEMHYDEIPQAGL